MFLSLPPKFWDAGHMLPCQAKTPLAKPLALVCFLHMAWVTEMSVKPRENVLDLGRGWGPHLVCLSCPSPFQLHPQRLQGGFNIKVRSLGVKILLH